MGGEEGRVVAMEGAARAARAAGRAEGRRRQGWG